LSKYRYLGYADVLKVGKKQFHRDGELDDEPKKKGDDK